MPAISSSAPGKAILFGEHAVVYGRPAIAVPVKQIQATAVAQPNLQGRPGDIWIDAPDILLNAAYLDLPPENPLALATRLTLQALGAAQPPACRIRITSTIPIASGLGSGAAFSIAYIRALSSYLGRPLPDETVSTLAYEVEKIFHGTPSGIDNTVITYAQPVFFIRGQPIEILKVAKPFILVIADTGVKSPTAVSVGDVRLAWQKDPVRYEGMFDAISEIVRSARLKIEAGDIHAIGALMDRNQALLADLNVSSPELERLIQVARDAGALGAKLSGGGRGGNLIALVNHSDIENVSKSLLASGATHVLVSTVSATGREQKLV